MEGWLVVRGELKDENRREEKEKLKNFQKQYKKKIGREGCG